MYNSLKTTLLGGILFLVPVVVLLAIIEKGLGYARKAVVPVANALFQGDFTHAFVGDLLAFVLLVVLCYLAGIAAKTAFARKYVVAVEKSVLVNVPGYDAAKSQVLAKLQSKEGDSASKPLTSPDKPSP
jgi:uncharacterized membrane protein